ncbi:putative phosphohydrolase, MPP superfamily [Halalkaliarchaeum sp. AArc-CO]|uniref:metallophosphoesterase n=1 Tax=Halalkaliarchaeum sp. AArc-CO TaxID=2866381 RepID=UPI00217CCF27|nr:metallophosphoesterase [Halalkaliarchaeum sp. AArc-CO]UWG51627.1 putative phosphohydrolase, MPP superfamily [Halalkaliarchaeum sp. AArc-CO]
MRDLTVRDRAAFLSAPDALVVADVHVGRDESSSVQFPLGERDDLVDRLDALLVHYDPDTVVFAGDLFHRFDRVSDLSRRGLCELVTACRRRDTRPVLVGGNHDTRLAAATDNDVHDAYALADGTVVCHGHEEPSVEGHRYVIGHLHPTISIEGNTYPCFLWGREAYDGADVLVLPAFNRLAPGVDVNGVGTADVSTPLAPEIDAFRPIVYDPDSQETLRFPPLSEFHRLL